MSTHSNVYEYNLKKEIKKSIEDVACCEVNGKRNKAQKNAK